MGSGETGTPTKTTKTTSASEEHPPNTAPMSYPEWAAATFQAYYGSGTASLPPPGYFPSTVASPHPYMWGAQPLMPPYGTPPPYAAMYPHGGMYTHPSMLAGTHPYSPYGLAAGNASEASMAATDGEGKSGEGKERSQLKRSKGSLGSLRTLTGKGSEAGKGTSAGINGVVSQSGDSGSEGSSEGSEGDSQNGAHGVEKGNYEQATSEAPSQNMSLLPYGSACDVNNQAVAAIPFSVTGKQPTVAGPMTNLNIGMDYWGGAAPAPMTSARGKWTSSAVATTAMIPSTPGLGPGRSDVPPELWLQDERELKRQRRKQSNRESARRSRLRKQAECEELAAKVESLTAENLSLRTELNRLTEQCKTLSKENSSLLEQLQSHGIQAVLYKKTDNEGVKCTNLENGGVKGNEVDDGSARNVRIENATTGLDGKLESTYDGKEPYEALNLVRRLSVFL